MTIATLSVTCLTLGLGADVSRTLPWLTFVPPSLAQGQAVTSEEIKSYAQIVMAIEPVRQSAYTEIKKILGTGDVPAISCDKPESLKNLPSNTRGIAINYCNQSKKIVESNGLSITRFNVITLQVQDNPKLEKQIQAELIRIQKAATTP